LPELPPPQPQRSSARGGREQGLRVAGPLATQHNGGTHVRVLEWPDRFEIDDGQEGTMSGQPLADALPRGGLQPGVGNDQAHSSFGPDDAFRRGKKIVVNISLAVVDLRIGPLKVLFIRGTEPFGPDVGRVADHDVEARGTCLTPVLVLDLTMVRAHEAEE